MSYLTHHAVSRPAVLQRRRRGARVDERTLLNLPGFDGGAHVRVYVEDTSNRKRRRLPSPRLKLRIADCVNKVNLEFSVDSAEQRENSLYKIETLITRSSGSVPASRPRRSSGRCVSYDHPPRAGVRRLPPGLVERISPADPDLRRHDRGSSKPNQDRKEGARCAT